MPLTCADCESYFDRIACREDDPTEAVRLAPHLESCTPCQEKLAGAKQFAVAMTDAMRSVPSTPDMTQLIPKLERGRSKKVLYFRLFWSAAAASVLIAVVLWYLALDSHIGWSEMVHQYSDEHDQLAQTVLTVRSSNGIKIDPIPLPEPDPVQDIQKKLPFEIKLPKHVPEGYARVKTRHMTEQPGIHLLYTHKNKAFSIFEIANTDAITMDRTATLGKDHVVIRSTPSVLFILVSPNLNYDELREILSSLTR